MAGVRSRISPRAWKPPDEEYSARAREAHFPVRVETASTKILYGSTMVFWNIPRARESGAAAGTRTDTASKPVSAAG